MFLELRNVHYVYPGNIEALKGVSINVSKSEVVAIIGPNGCGKTTLLLVAAGLLDPNEGEVLIDGRELKNMLPDIRRKIGILFQDPDDQLFNPTVYDELAFGLKQLKFSNDEIESKVKTIAKLFEIEGILERQPYRLSFGEKKIVALASILVYDPEILLFDEPTSNLSFKYLRKIENVVSNAKINNKAVIIASHNVEFVAKVADRIYVLNEGKVIGEGTVKKVLTNEKLLALADMEPPIAFKIAKQLKLKPCKTPITIDELLKCLRTIL